MNDILVAKMENKKNVKYNLVSVISKIGEKISLRRSDCVESDKFMNFSYMHSAVKKNLGKIGVLLSLETKIKKEKLLDFGKQLAILSKYRRYWRSFG